MIGPLPRGSLGGLRWRNGGKLQGGRARFGSVATSDGPEFDRLIGAALAQPFEGWSFEWLRGRLQQGAPPWDFRALLRQQMKPDTTLLDLGTGGGEFLVSLAPLPRRCIATEGYRPNLPIARRRLAPYGVAVIPTGRTHRLPLADGSVHLVVDRHEAFSPREVQRVLREEGWFITQQVGSQNNRELRAWFGTPPERATNHVSSAAALAREVNSSGLAIRRSAEASFPVEFRDIGAIVYYLRAAPWEVPGFQIDRDRERLLEMHKIIRRDGAFRTSGHRLLVLAQREARS